MMQSHFDFEWSPAKAASNLKKHGVGFDEAATVFDDTFSFVQADELHSDQEAREVIVGYSERYRLLIVSFVRRADERIRIIGARPVTQRERKIYEEKTRL